MILLFDELAEYSASIHNRGETIVTTNGCFDIIHRGHVDSLTRAADMGDVLLVGLNTDTVIKALKGENRPIVSQEDRACVVDAFSVVDDVVLFPQADPCRFVELVRPNIHVKGGDYDPDKMIETPVVRRYGGQVVVLPLVPDRSTSATIRSLKGT
jgi:rfaE bifunctional protein nucleotidyltransferase chain/domain